MKKEFTAFPLYEFSGTEREIGRQYGEECKDKIQHMINWWYDNLVEIMPDKSLKEMMAATKQFEAPIKDYAPELYDEIVGIAEGSGASLEEILFLQGSYELDAAFPVFMACTSYACSGKATKDGKTLLGQNYDWYTASDVVVLRIKPQNGPSYLTVTLAGHLGQVGINEYGIGQFVNILLYPKSVVGVPYNVIANKVLLQKNVPDQIRAITQAPRAIAFNHMLAGKDGEIIDVETSPDKCGCILPDRDILAHSNHYLCHYLQQYDLNDQSSFPDSFLRQYRLQQLMEDKRGELCPQVMMQILQDHRGWPDSICRHLDMQGPTFERFETSMSMISVPEEGKIYATANPCENPNYHLYTL